MVTGVTAVVVEGRWSPPPPTYEGAGGGFVLSVFFDLWCHCSSVAGGSVGFLLTCSLFLVGWQFRPGCHWWDRHFSRYYAI